MNSKIFDNIKKRNAAIVVGAVYFLSDFYDKSGAMVRVTAKSDDINAAGWPSKISYDVIETIGESRHYGGTCNSANLYATRADAAWRRIIQ